MYIYIYMKPYNLREPINRYTAVPDDLYSTEFEK